MEFITGKTFSSKRSLQECIEEYSIDKRFKTSVKKSNKNHLNVVCKSSACPFAINGSYNKKQNCWKLSKAELSHSEECNTNTTMTNSVNTSWLRNSIQNEVLFNKHVSPMELQNRLHSEYNVDLPYWKIWRAKRNLLNDHFNPFSQIGLLRSYASEITTKNEGSIFNIECHENVFQKLFVTLGCWMEMLKYSTKMIFLDGTFLNGEAKGTLLTATSLDSNNNLFNIGFAIVDVENSSNWTWFANNLKNSIKEIETKDIVFVSDREKGLINAIQTVFSASTHIFCMKHIIRNMSARFPMREITPIVWKAAYATSELRFNTYMNQIEIISRDAAAFLSSIPVIHWSQFAIGVCTFGQKTNNVAESFNSKIRDSKSDSYFMLSRKIINDSLTFIQKGHATMQFENGITTFANKLIKERSKMMKNYITDIITGKKAYVSNKMDTFFIGDDHLVDLEKRTCTCVVFQDTKLPCVHALCCI